MRFELVRDNWNRCPLCPIQECLNAHNFKPALLNIHFGLKVDACAFHAKNPGIDIKSTSEPNAHLVRAALETHELRAGFDQRPWYRRNDYLGWICAAKREATKSKRLNQMLEQLRAGNVYMKVAWRPRSGSNSQD